MAILRFIVKKQMSGWNPIGGVVGGVIAGIKALC
jgi:hypothetical protein